MYIDSGLGPDLMKFIILLVNQFNENWRVLL